MIDEIISDVRKEVEVRKREVPVNDLPARKSGMRSLSEAILRSRFIPIIAEIKPRSPSEGLLRKPLDVRALAKDYEAGGAVAISVLTEPKYFGGSLDSLVEVKSEVDLPVLRKDFIVDEYQIHESAAYGADSILLISSCAGDKLSDFLALTKDLGLEAIVECRSAQDVKLAVDAGAKIIGVNNRDLHTLKIDLGVTKRLAGYVPSDTILISESGIRTAEDIRFLMGAGANAVLIGTVLMRSKVPGEMLQKFVQAVEIW
ncbi:MAG: indole-3-glycerol phosphate synthase TrpC [Methanocellales archaeon]|nr:indole-3-glycerol phosphate synthase TrpC [Methanocellales archaeon]MDD3291043.1 indole-3-glycerol phosphate synthase TrpC [Methanocellales archaeon]MDD5234928.1 indole-3-glycerol phosphate synthase TrpC [Methanocellales archaeon]MDD5484702.1 indole-3-glycerol phosphate synthase TrpC [Methanocellales archaeon]